jgi:hypothetical protein
MSFAPRWLELREPFDAAARDGGLAIRLARWASGRQRLQVVDLGSGTGANYRWLAPRLPVAQDWRLIERDPVLIAAGRDRLPPGPWRYQEADLAPGLGELIGKNTGLITASALIDLVSEGWLAALARAVRETRSALYVALTYDGRVGLAPAHPFDGAAIELANQHQRIDKGFGPALGPEAAGRLIVLLKDAGGRLEMASSDWLLGPVDRDIQKELIEGWAQAALEVGPARAGAVEAWREARLAALPQGLASTRVGHADILWLPG